MPDRTPAPDPMPDDLVRLWSAVLERVTLTMGKSVVDQWIRPLRLRGIESDTVLLLASSSFLSDWVERNYGLQLLRAIQSLMPTVRRIEFAAAEGDMPAICPTDGANGRTGVFRTVEDTPKADEDSSSGGSASDGEDDLLSSPLDPRFTFDSFVVGKPNELAHAAARRVAETCDASFNPVFLYGGVGLGKTHLMHAIGRHLCENRPNARVLYLSAEQFMYRFVQALRSRDMLSFKTMFRSVDVLMIDDVQFICGKDSTQDEFFHTFNALIDQKKQIVISGDRSPDRMDGMEDRIKSRLQWGLVVDIHPTDYELRLGILQTKADAMRAASPGVDLDPKVLEFLAHRISSNVRVLEGALTRLFAFASLVGRRIDLEMTTECLADLLRHSERKVSVDDIKRKVCDHYNVRHSDLVSQRRARAIARPRQVAMYLAKTLTSKSLPEIGRGFGNRDHTTVIHAVKKIEELRSTDGQIAEDLELLRRSLEA